MTTNTNKTIKTVRARLQEARDIILSKSVKKSGYNSFTKFYYYELEDFIPLVIKTFKEVGLTSSFSFKNRCAKLSIEILDPYLTDMNIIDFRKDFELDIPEEFDLNDVVHASYNKETKEYKKPNPMQVIGSMNTYLKRYLYLNALELTESDEVNATIGSDDNKPAKNNETSNQITNFKSIGEVNYVLKNHLQDMSAEQKKSLHHIAANKFHATYDKNSGIYITA